MVQPPAQSGLPPVAPPLDSPVAQALRSNIAADSESLFRAYVETANDMVYTVDLSGQLTFINPYGERLLGVEPGGWLGRAYMDFVAPRYQAATAEAFFNLMQTGELIDFEFAVIDQQGNEVQMQVNGRLLYCNGELIGGLGIARDITERKRFEQQLRMFMRALESIHDSAIVADLQGQILYANPATERLFGRGLGTNLANQPANLGAILQPMANLSEFYPEPGQVSWLIERAIAGGGRGEAICQRAGGERFPAVVSVGAVPGEDGQTQAVSIICRDISDQRQAQARLAAQNLALERASRLKSEFLANMSHELRTPLTSILGFSGMLDRQLYGPLNPKQSVYVRQIHASGRHLLELINDVLDLSKVEAGQIELAIEPIEIAALCEESLALVEQQASDRALTLERMIAPDLDPLLADRLRVKQMLLNLLSNAIKFSNEGSQVSLHVHSEAGYLYLAVRDQGIGIPPEARDLLFQPFQQLDSSLARRHQGTGLGLALTRQLAELHGGTVDYESELGTGSTFTIRLPLSWHGRVAAAAVSPQFSPPPLAQGGEAAAPILVIEDDPDNAKLLQDLLGGWGYRTAIAPHGEAAFDWLASHHPSLILLDLHLPGQDGFAIFRRLRQNPDWAGLPVVAATAMAMERDRTRCLNVGMQDYLSKPIDDEALAEVLQKYVGPGRSPQEVEEAIALPSPPGQSGPKTRRPRSRSGR